MRQKSLKVSKQSTYHRKTIDEELYSIREKNPGSVVKDKMVMVENKSIAWFEKETQEVRRDDARMEREHEDENEEIEEQEAVAAGGADQNYR